VLRTVHLHGRLGQRFGKSFDLAVNSPAEAVRALVFQLPGFASYIRDRNYQLTIGDGALIDRDSLHLQLGGQRDIHITPAGAVAGIETILLVGTLLLSAISAIAVLAMPKAPIPSAREEATKTASFIFDGAQNVTEQGHKVPLVYGRIRTGSVVGSAGITTTDVNAASLSTDPTNPTYGGGAEGGGDYGGYVGSSPGIGGGRFGNSWVDLAKGGKGGSATARSAQEDANSLQSQATAKVLDIISEGEIVGLVDGMKSIYFDETPLQNADDSFNFAGVSVEHRVGLPDQDFVPGFDQAENSREINTKVSVALGAVTRSIEDASASVARVTIRLPQLYQQDTTNGDLKASSVSVKISVQVDGGGFTDVATMDFEGKTNSGYQRSLDVRLPVGEDREVRVTRLTADSAVASLVNETWWDLLTEVVEAKLSYPDTALIGLTVDARQFGSSIPERSYDIKGLIIEVPTNYDPETRAYDGIWDGTFKRAWSDNPAWVLRDIIVNRRYGLGGRVPAASVDIWGLYAIAQHCDEMVPNFEGGEAPRYTINVAITNAASAYDVIASIASNFRGWVYWGSGTVMAAQDRAEDPSILLTPSNVVDGRFHYGRVTPSERRRSVAIVYWNDPDDGYRLNPEIVEAPDLIRRFGRRAGENIAGFGITNRGQAHRMALWTLEDEKPSSNSAANYEVGDDHAFVEPGRIASIADPMFTNSRRGGRVKSATADTIEMDAPFTLLAGQDYQLRVILPDGTASVRPIANAAGETSVLNLDGADWTLSSSSSSRATPRCPPCRSAGKPAPTRASRSIRRNSSRPARTGNRSATGWRSAASCPPAGRATGLSACARSTASGARPHGCSWTSRSTARRTRCPRSSPPRS
jgi:predicted phage tail protein